MSIVHPLDLRGPAIFRCAQAGCAECVDRLVRQHEGLVHTVLRRQACGDAVYADLLQEGRLGLWQAAVHFDQARVAFSTYAGVAIERRVWRAVARKSGPAGRMGRGGVGSRAGGPLSKRPGSQAQVQVALPDALRHLPSGCAESWGPRMAYTDKRRVAWQRWVASMRSVVNASGMCGMKPWSCWRLPAVSGRLRQICGQDDRVAYQQADRAEPHLAEKPPPRGWLHDPRRGVTSHADALCWGRLPRQPLPCSGRIDARRTGRDTRPPRRRTAAIDQTL